MEMFSKLYLADDGRLCLNVRSYDREVSECYYQLATYWEERLHVDNSKRRDNSNTSTTRNRNRSTRAREAL
jgi:hypothetical protein